MTAELFPGGWWGTAHSTLHTARCVLWWSSMASNLKLASELMSASIAASL